MPNGIAFGDLTVEKESRPSLDSSAVQTTGTDLQRNQQISGNVADSERSSNFLRRVSQTNLIRKIVGTVSSVILIIVSSVGYISIICSFNQA